MYEKSKCNSLRISNNLSPALNMMRQKLTCNYDAEIGRLGNIGNIHTNK